MERFKPSASMELGADIELSKLNRFELQAFRQIADVPNDIDQACRDLHQRGLLISSFEGGWRLSSTGLDLVPFLDRRSDD